MEVPQIASIFPAENEGQTAGQAQVDNGVLHSVADWIQKNVSGEITADTLTNLHRDALEKKLITAVEERYRPEIRRMERLLLLELVDSGWKEHLLAMDHLRSAVGLVGYAQVDPKVEYKREGMKLFDEKWYLTGERVTELIFRMEQLDETFVGSTWAEGVAKHDQAQSTTELAEQQHAAIQSSQGEKKAEPFRNRRERLGRNDACSCGSGKKYKNCCMRKQSGQ